MNKSTKDDQFWLIFDTGTEREYYKDLHNLLALPDGYTIRYSYRSDWITTEGMSAATEFPACSTDVLLIYIQYVGFEKGNDVKAYSDDAPKLSIPTRFATLSHIEIDKDKYYFDLKLLGYPSPRSNALADIISSLQETREMPFWKWVCLSDRIDDLENLKKNSTKESDNWHSIVDRFLEPGSQFRNDSFWRIKDVHKGGLGHSIGIRYEEQRKEIAGKKKVSAIIPFYPIYENQRIMLEIVNQEPRIMAGTKTTEGDVKDFNTHIRPTSREIVFDDSGCPLQASVSRKPLRPYFKENFEFRAIPRKEFGQSEGYLLIRTDPSNNDWPVGPEFRIRFRLRKKAIRIALGIMALILSPTSIWLVRTLPNLTLFVKVLLMITGPILFLLAAWLLTRSIRLP